jgi:hypothetical protein
MHHYLLFTGLYCNPVETLGRNWRVLTSTCGIWPIQSQARASSFHCSGWRPLAWYPFRWHLGCTQVLIDATNDQEGTCGSRRLQDQQGGYLASTIACFHSAERRWVSELYKTIKSMTINNAQILQECTFVSKYSCNPTKIQPAQLFVKCLIGNSIYALGHY